MILSHNAGLLFSILLRKKFARIKIWQIFVNLQPIMDKIVLIMIMMWLKVYHITKVTIFLRGQFFTRRNLENKFCMCPYHEYHQKTSFLPIFWDTLQLIWGNNQISHNCCRNLNWLLFIRYSIGINRGDIWGLVSFRGTGRDDMSMQFAARDIRWIYQWTLDSTNPDIRTVFVQNYTVKQLDACRDLIGQNPALTSCYWL